MPDFLPVLIIAIVCLVALLLVFGGGFISFPYSRAYPSRYLPSDRTIEFNYFEVSYISGEENVGYVGGEVSNGVFATEEKRTGFNVLNPDEVSEALINLKVWNTNYYGRMIILVNGKEVYADYPPVGEKLIGFDPSVLKENNILEVKAENSGWKIWAPTVYAFDMDVKVDYLARKTKTFDFELTDLETEYMDKARIVVFGDRQGTGNLDIRINDVKVYEGITTVYKDFPVSVLKTGNNTIEFSTEPNTRYDISSAQIILFFG
jgi:ASC-1-like (ASCH) protein